MRLTGKMPVLPDDGVAAASVRSCAEAGTADSVNSAATEVPAPTSMNKNSFRVTIRAVWRQVRGVRSSANRGRPRRTGEDHALTTGPDPP